MKCKQCDNLIEYDARFCNKCGNEIPLKNSLTDILTFLRKIPKNVWLIIIIATNILAPIYGLIVGVLGFFIWKSINSTFAKKLLKISVIVTLIMVLVIFAYLYFTRF